MAAYARFNSFNETLSPKDQTELKDFVKEKKEDMFAARSEDERVRLVNEYIEEVTERLLRKK